MRRKRILTHFGQVGGANALLPLIEQCALSKEIVISARRLVAKHLALKDISALDWGMAEDLPGWMSIMAGRFRTLAPDLVITDTLDLTRAKDGLINFVIWRLAAESKIPCLAYVDCWWGYIQRFRLEAEPDGSFIGSFPGTIAAIDSLVRGSMIEQGFPPESIKVLGSPLYEELMRKAAGFPAAASPEAKEKAAVPQDRFLILFVSQPHEKHLGPEEEWGFTEKTILRQVLDCLGRIVPQIENKPAVLVLLHPEEIGQEMRAIAESFRDGIDTMVRTGGIPIDYLIAADLVIGISSTLLTEAVILGRPVLSVQIGLQKEDILPTNTSGASIRIESEEELCAHLFRSLTQPGYLKALSHRYERFDKVIDASRRWQEEIDTLINSL